MRYLAVCIFSASLALGQSSAPAFDVASVKPAVPGTTGARIQYLPGGRFNGTNIPLIYLIADTYQLREFQIAGDPQWMSVIADSYNGRYDIQAKANESATQSEMKEMLKTLLADRVKLKFHTETRAMSVYALVPGKGGVKLAAAKDNGKPRGSGAISFMLPGWIQGNNVAMPMLIQSLSEYVDRPVVDKTNFTDAFDFRLTFTPDLVEDRAPSEGTCPASFTDFAEQRHLGVKPSSWSCPSIFTAVQDQLGLKLDFQKDPIEVLVIDHAERPLSN